MQERYQKNIDEIFSLNLQNILLTKKVAVIGCGGQGGYILEYLARLGVDSLIFWDGDKYELSNLNRQFGCTEKTIGLNKAEVLSEKIKEINSNINIVCCDWFFGDNQDDIDLISKVDIIFYAADCYYNVEIIRMLLREFILMGIPVIDSPVNTIGGFVSIDTNKSLMHFDYQTKQEIQQSKEDIPPISQPAYKCALLAAEAVNQMVQYFDQSIHSCKDCVLILDLYHHKYIKKDYYGEF